MKNLFRLGLALALLPAIAGISRAGGIIVPAYFYPSNGGAYGDDWYQLAAAATYMKSNGKNGYNTLIAIGNADSGPGKSADPNYISAFKAVRANGGKVIGYVDTNTGKNSLSEVESQINSWISFYGSQLDGIFLDNWSAYEPGVIPGSNPSMTYAAYYGELQTYVKTTKRLSILCGNPGVEFDVNERDPSAAHLADIILIHEDYYSKGTNWTVPVWTQTPGLTQVAGAIYHDMPIGNQTVETNVILDATVTKRLAWIYVTDDTQDPNPYGLLPGVRSGGKDGQWNPYWGNEEYTAGVD